MIYNLATSKFTGKALVVKLKELGFEQNFFTEHNEQEPYVINWQRLYPVNSKWSRAKGAHDGGVSANQSA